MRDILAGIKKEKISLRYTICEAIKMDKIRLIAIPYYDSLSILRNWKDIKQLYPDILQYFLNYDSEYLPSRKYFWEIFASLHYQDAKEMIDNERRRKFEKKSNSKTKEIIINK